MTTKLDPIKATPFLSVVEGRRPRQKTHTALAHAKNAFDTPHFNPLVPGYAGRRMGMPTHGWGAIYEFKDGDWELLYEIPQPTPDDEIPAKYGPKYETRPWRLDNGD